LRQARQLTVASPSTLQAKQSGTALQLQVASFGSVQKSNDVVATGAAVEDSKGGGAVEDASSFSNGKHVRPKSPRPLSTIPRGQAA
jgi:hypothetical protein